MQDILIRQLDEIKSTRLKTYWLKVIIDLIIDKKYNKRAQLYIYIEIALHNIEHIIARDNNSVFIFKVT